MNSSRPYSIVVRAAVSAGNKVLKYFRQIQDPKQDDLRKEEKSMPGDLRTEADLASQTIILKALKEAFPEDGILSEESDFQEGNGHRVWVVDPLDGTKNFTQGIPIFVVSIALVENNEVKFAIIRDPVNQITLMAEKGVGAFVNDSLLFLSDESELRRSTIVTAFGYDYYPTCCQVTNRVAEQVGLKRLVSPWSPAWGLAQVSRGFFDACVSYGVEPHDIMAGRLIAQEAGAKLTALDGSPHTNCWDPSFIISNGTALHDQVVEHFGLPLLEEYK